jgi:hypothetical protein
MAPWRGYLWRRTYDSDGTVEYGHLDEADVGQVRAPRGGTWDDDPFYVRTAYRLYITPDSRGDSIGSAAPGELPEPLGSGL